MLKEATELNKYLFYLSGSNKTLPRAEALAAIQALGIRYRIIHSYDQVLVIEAQKINGVFERLALCHGIYEFLGMCPPQLRDILSLAEKVGPILAPPVAVRIRRLRGRWRELRSDVLEREIGAAIGLEVNLSKPASMVVGFLSERFFLGREITPSARKKGYSERHPTTRPFFHPGVLLPKIARAVANLTRIRRGDKLIDPFCGTGGILAEAGLMGARVYGCDIDPEMVAGCEKNLRYYGISERYVEVGDARHIVNKYPSFFDAIATDPPYGISASTWGVSPDKLYKEVFPSFYGMLKNNGYACVLSPDKIATEEYASESGFTLVETHYDRVHAGLTRKILVVKK